MKVSFLECANDDWVLALSRCIHDVYQTPAWVSASSSSDGGIGLLVYVVDGTKELLIPMIRRELASGEWDALSPYGYGGFAGTWGDDTAFVDRALERVKVILKEMGCISLFIRLHPILNQNWVSSIGVVIAHGLTVSVDLKKTPEQHWKETMSGHRGDIQKAKREGIVVHLDRKFETLKQFISIYHESMERLSASKYYYFDDNYFLSLVDGLGDKLLLFSALENNVVIGASMFTLAPSSGIMQYHLSGASSAFRHRQPAKIILDTAREWGRENGYNTLHLGGGLGGAEDSLFKFKRGFSPNTHRFHTQRIVVNEKRYIELTGLNSKDLYAADRFPAYRH